MIDNILVCRFCNKECKNANSLRNHERLCKCNPNRSKIVSNFTKYNLLRKEGKIIRKGVNQFTKAVELGIEKPIVSDETKDKIRKKAQLRRHTAEEREHLSKIMSQIARENPEKYSISQIHKRTKHFTYQGYRIDGEWELIVAKYLDSQNIRWEKCSSCFEYVWLEKSHCYYPDFYLPDFHRYIEVKGYETPRDLEKYKVVKNLILIKLKEINLIKKNQYNIINMLS